jgi:hypothetical protein
VTYSSEYDAQVEAIRTAILTVPDVGRVHDRPRYGDFRERWVATIGGVDQIRAWEISAQPDEVVRREQGRRHRYRTWQITGTVGLEDLSIEADPEASATSPNDSFPDASYHHLRRLAGEIGDALDTARPTWVAAGTFIDTDPTQQGEPTVITIGGGALCWGTILTIRGYTIVTP